MVLIISCAVCSCASHHDLSKGRGLFGGGVQDEEVLQGLHKIVAITNWAPWENYGAARRSWKRLAEKACGKGNYKELRTSEQSMGGGVAGAPQGAYIVTEKRGYALCLDAITSEQEAKLFIDNSG